MPNAPHFVVIFIIYIATCYNCVVIFSFIVIDCMLEMSPLHGENSSAELLSTDSSVTVNGVQREEGKTTPLHESQIQQQKRGKVVSNLKNNASDYRFWHVLGEGSFSTVFLATDVNYGRQFAIKVCEKRHIVKERKVEYVQREKEVLNLINSTPCTTSPFFVKLYHAFQDVDRLYFVLTFARNGELLSYINDGQKFDFKCTQFYAAEILCSLEHLHRLGIVHRDLKPENILFGDSMHILLTDFGSAKIFEDLSLGSEEGLLDKHRSRSGSFVGTAQYVSPELLNEQNVSFSSDLWALGCIIYQMIEGSPPFFGKSEPEIFQKIRKLEFSFHDSFNPVAKNLIQKLLVLDVSSRLGASDVDTYVSVRSHKLFSGIDFERLYQEIPPLKPSSKVIESHKIIDSIDPSIVRSGLDTIQLSRLLGLSLRDSVSATSNQPSAKVSITTILNSPEEIRQRLDMQIQSNEWHTIVEGNLILRHGIVFKRKGLLTKKLVLLLTTGPHLYYADPGSRMLKGEVPWSSELHEQAKNFKTFFVHTPERSFRWDDPKGNALLWCDAIKEVRMHLTERNV